MKKLTRNPEKFDVLELFSSMATTNGYKINNLSSVEEFISCVKSSIEESAKNDITKFGKRIESQFAYVVGALGKTRLLKQEDSGNIYYVDDEIIAPDYKVILNDDSQILIEVKNFYSNDLTKEFTLEKDYYIKLQKYSDINKISLKFAIYFTIMNQWVLLPISAFKENDTSYTIDLANAMAKSEMALLGDRMIATTPNLEIHILTNNSEAKIVTASGITDFTIRDTKFLCSNKEVTDDIEKNIFFNFIRFGTWIEEESEAIMDNDKLLGIKIVYAPKELTEQGFEVIGLLSSMISNKFKELTIKNGEVESMDLGINPSQFKIFIPDDYDSEILPLWQFIMSPSKDFKRLEEK
jgi:Holliday junction resolvase